MTRDEMAEKVRKLLAKARDPCLPESEALLFANKARDLMIKFELDEMAVSGERADEMRFEAASFTTPNAEWRRFLYNAASKMYFCAYCYSETLDGSDEHVIFGGPANREAARSFGDYLCTAVMRKLAAALLSTGLAEGERDAFSETFLNVATMRIMERVQELLQTGAGKPTGETLPTIIGLEKEVEQAFADLIAGATVEHSSLAAKNKHMEGAVAGFKAANDVSLSKQIGGGGEAPKQIY